MLGYLNDVSSLNLKLKGGEIMKGVILAAGIGSRLKPLTGTIGKEMLPVYNQPIIFYVIDALISGGISQILLIVHSSTIDLYKKILMPHDYYDRINYAIDEKPGGPGRSLLLAKEWVGQNNFALILGDSIFFTPLPLLEEKNVPHIFAMYLDDAEDDLSKYGQIEIIGNKVVKKIEKPKIKFSNIIQTAIWLFSPDVFSKIPLLENLKEIQIADLISLYLREKTLDCTFLPNGSYLDCGTFESLFRANVRMRAKIFNGGVI